MAGLLILGSGTGLPNARRNAPGYLLSAAGKNILIDSGPGALQRLKRYGVTYHDIDYLFYTHLHPDHTLDFASVLFASRNPQNPRRKDLVVIGPPAMEDFYNKLLALYGTSVAPELYKVIFKKAEENLLDLGFCNVSTRALEHSDGNIGFRIEIDKKILTYSGDTDYCDNIVSLAKDADILILECSSPEGFKMKGHLVPALAGRIASESRCKKLILTHMYPLCDGYPILKQCKAHFKGKVILANDYMRLKL